MTFQESETLELKEIVVEDIKKEIIAFAHFVQTPFFSIIISPNIFFFIF